MQKKLIRLSFWIVALAGFSLMSSCTKEHLDPPDPIDTHPLVYLSAYLNGDSIFFAGGVNGYVGNTSVSDTLNLRTFNFTLKNPQNPLHSCFQLSINNYSSILGQFEHDIANTIYPDSRHYQDYSHFIPLAATIIWVDSSGVKFTSTALVQNHPFIITAVEDVVFENKPYKKTTVEFDCNLSDAHGHTLHVTHGRAVVLFAASE